MTEGIEEKWTGTFFTPTRGRRYFIPKDSGNYPELRGKRGVCIGFKQTANGHSWAIINLDDPLLIVRVRTTNLKPEQGERETLREEFRDFPVADVVSEAILGGYSGPVELKGM